MRTNQSRGFKWCKSTATRTKRGKARVSQAILVFVHDCFSDWLESVTSLRHSSCYKYYSLTVASIWRENMLGYLYLSADIICSEKRTVFRECSSRKRKTTSFEKQIMSKVKYPSVFSPQMETIVLIILQIFFATRAVLKIS